MKPATEAECEERSELYKGLLRKAKISFDEHSLVICWAGTSESHPEGYLIVHFAGDDLTFEALAEASRFLGTRRIDIGCDHGCSSDPCHERVLTFYGALGL
jgi:hypothetical protein